MPDPEPEEEPTLLRKVVSGIFVVALVLAVYFFIEWRTAPPPPPNIPLPEPTPEMMKEGWFPDIPGLPEVEEPPLPATPPPVPKASTPAPAADVPPASDGGAQL